MAARHPEHDLLHQEVRSWYRTSAPQLGYYLVQRRFGFYRHHANHPESGRIIVEALTPGEVPELLADASSYFDNRAVDVWLDDKDLDAAVGPALVAEGCSIDKAITYLAHVGPRPERVQLPGVTVEAVTPDTLLDYVLVKLKGFANSEDAPAVEDVDKELAVRRSELASLGRFLIARFGDEPAAILGYYDGSDRLVFNLATRMPFRMRGIARHLLCGVIADSCDQGCRSAIINTDPNDTPIQWYRRLGFTDEVYWRRSYLFEPARNPLLLRR
ncbi:MAG TPA: GNAT family N-acetyltransferase [Candidatus Binatus sp.]|uniref:GNAT family N-acetyltransferase n=1 Tax=Candidatus Binatus sp. TaxID=2811406 RepID=UPI002F3E391C